LALPEVKNNHELGKRISEILSKDYWLWMPKLNHILKLVFKSTISKMWDNWTTYIPLEFHEIIYEYEIKKF
jgi:hypothetical protein